MNEYKETDIKDDKEADMKNNMERSAHDDKMIMQFLAEHREEIADNGFTEQILRQLPQPARQNRLWLNRLWTAACTVAGLVMITHLCSRLSLTAIKAEALSVALSLSRNLTVSIQQADASMERLFTMGVGLTLLTMFALWQVSTSKQY